MSPTHRNKLDLKTQAAASCRLALGSNRQFVSQQSEQHIPSEHVIEAKLGPETLEVAILDANRPRRAFRRITGSALEALLPQADPSDSVESTDTSAVDS